MASDTGSAPAEPRLAATVIICRHSPITTSSNSSIDYQVLFVKRHSKARFMPNFHVFPGGILEPSDSAPEWKSYLSHSASKHAFANDSEPLRIAAIREVFEESNVLLSNAAALDDNEVAEWRERVQKDSAMLLQMCKANGLSQSTVSLHDETLHCIADARLILCCRDQIGR
jgi:8-oxo-dGTP pyrophosphatase MutT (NUDIX family)